MITRIQLTRDLQQARLRICDQCEHRVKTKAGYYRCGLRTTCKCSNAGLALIPDTTCPAGRW